MPRHNDDPIPLTQLPHELEAAAQAAGLPTPKYRMLYSRAVDRELPARQLGKFWFVARQDLPAIKQLLGLVPGGVVKSPKARKAAAAAPVPVPSIP